MPSRPTASFTMNILVYHASLRRVWSLPNMSTTNQCPDVDRALGVIKLSALCIQRRCATMQDKTHPPNTRTTLLFVCIHIGQILPLLHAKSLPKTAHLSSSMCVCDAGLGMSNNLRVCFGRQVIILFRVGIAHYIFFVCRIDPVFSMLKKNEF